ncbi:hypothetical protein AMTR_s00104p00100980 [Amborella trichopoda]|uniref:Uncharacterized protein n=1 Tax=Amborella trichopoda TaxID=13333 RepID=W1NYB2_AMBTC|nr:hypothetical protein AMTR_s00104p00100980 [Amborella trichopoda]
MLRHYVFHALLDPQRSDSKHSLFSTMCFTLRHYSFWSHNAPAVNTHAPTLCVSRSGIQLLKPQRSDNWYTRSNSKHSRSETMCFTLWHYIFWSHNAPAIGIHASAVNTHALALCVSRSGITASGAAVLRQLVYTLRCYDVSLRR